MRILILLLTLSTCAPAQAQTWTAVGTSSSLPTQTWNYLLWTTDCVFVSTFLGNTQADGLKGIWRACPGAASLAVNAVPTSGWTKVFSDVGTAGHSRANIMMIDPGTGRLIFDQNGNGCMWYLTTPLTGSPTATQTSACSLRGLATNGGNYFSMKSDNTNVIWRSTDGGATYTSFNSTIPGNSAAAFTQTSDGRIWAVMEAAAAYVSSDGWATKTNVGTAPNTVSLIYTLLGKVIGADVDNYPRLWDGATTWTRYDSGITNGGYPYNTPNVFAQATDGTLYMCGKGIAMDTVTKQGVYAYKSTDEGAHWTAASSGLPVYNTVHTGTCQIGPDGYLYLGISVNDAVVPATVLGSDSGLYRISVQSPVVTSGGTGHGGALALGGGIAMN